MGIPSVAIITRTKDRPELLRRTLASVLQQSYADWVWVLVNSGDPGPVEELLAEFAEPLAGRVEVVQLEGQPLMGAASNAGVRGSDSRFVVLLDDDDTWDPTFLAKTIGVLEGALGECAGGVVTRTMRIDEAREMEGGEWVEQSREPFNQRLRCVHLFDLAGVNRFTVNAFVYRRSVYEEIGGYREDLPVLDDWDFNLRFLQCEDVAVVPEALANYHVRSAEGVGASANSLIAGEGLHEFYYAALINRNLRDDLSSGRTGLGFLMGAASGNRRSEDELNRLRRKLAQMSQKIGRVDARTKELKDRLSSSTGR